MSDAFSRANDEVNKLDPSPPGPHGWIQWKGTQVCIDLHCACGVHGHLDTDFLYEVHCIACGQYYSLSPNVRLVPITKEQAAALGGRAVDFDEHR